VPGNSPTLSQQRAEIGLPTPSWKARKMIWAGVKSPTARISRGYKPLASVEPAHRADARGVAVSGGWRGGKSLYSGMEGTAWLPYGHLIWLIAKDYERTRPEFTYLAEAGMSTGLVLPGNVHMPLAKHQPWALRGIPSPHTAGCIVETVTLADYRKSLTAKAPDVVIVCEPGLIDDLPGVVELLAGRLSEKRGLLILAGTSDEASEEWYEVWDGWNSPNPEGGVSFSVPTWDNLYRYPKGRDEHVFKVYEEKYGTEALMAHYGGVPASPRDLVLRGYWKYGLHVDEELEFNESRPVEVAIDPGYSGASHYVVEAVQWDPGGDHIWLVDEISAQGLIHDEMRALCEARPWWRYVMSGTMDPYAGVGHFNASPAPVAYWNPIEIRFNHRPRVNVTVQALKEALARRGDRGPRMTVSPRCSRFIHEAPRWRNERSGNPAKTLCDAMKATGYWLVDRFGDERLGIDEEDNIVTARDWEFDG